jgi:hypothetical protein
MPVTPIYSLPYQALADPPDGAGLGEDLALAVESELARIDGDTPDYLDVSRIAAGSVSVTPIPNSATVANILWGKTLPGTVYLFATAESGSPNVVKEVMAGAVNEIGGSIYLLRTNNTATTVHWIAFGL